MRDRDCLLHCFHSALEAVHGGTVVRRALGRLKGRDPIHLVAIGKAAAAMAEGARTILGERLVRALVITRHGHADPRLSRDQRFICLQADHPLPGADSLLAGGRLLDFIRLTPEQGHMVFLISGGTSSLVEVLPPGAGLGELQRVNGWLLGSGLDILAMNRVRAAISCIKGGRLRSHLGQRRAEAYLISDVPGDDPAVIGSGLLVPPSVARPLPELPPGIREWVTAMAARVPDCTDTSGVAVPVHVVATLRDACRAAAAAAERCGMNVTLHGEFLRGEAAPCGERLARELLAGPPGIHIWGGETTVTLPADPGLGGRNQHLALAAARVLAGHPGMALLAAGTDGSDGNTRAAGALVDAGTAARAGALGLDVEQALAGADAHVLLKACGDLVTTGPTGTNVMDLVIGIRQS
ncbi:glycerate kinase type-2 family protein [Ectothiorhodospira shaposhnikovii]|uniref:glycerate kinase type-2 family protein n=1 Tax=Ectothiorhodospira shaposhnikovii TaxID=1054 RepID=UPI001EE941B3|nr:DUF4147 domain-containing protein [Ectothiorhodospira shaposhnikovii]MCG5513692.1 DUF4147 domain-containing protein [Ectothiorhodospira shaposhnikovii]